MRIRRWRGSLLLSLLLLLLPATGCARTAGGPVAGSPPGGPSGSPPAGAAAAASIAVDGERYALPPGVPASGLLWAAAPDRIYWAAAGDAAIHSTPRQASGGSLATGVSDLAPVLLPPEREGAARLTQLTVSGNWLLYTTTVYAPDGRAIGHRLYAVDRTNPQNSKTLGAPPLGGDQHFLFAAAGDTVVWQQYAAASPDGRFTLGRTHVVRLRPQAEWDLPGAAWGKALRIEQATLLIERPDGSTERRSLEPPAAAGAEAVLAAADFDGDGREDQILVRRGGGGQIESLRVQAADGRTLLSVTSQAAGPGGLPLADAWVADVGAPTPALLLAGTGGSGGMPLTAYVYSQAKGALVPAPWANAPNGVLAFPSLDPDSHAVILAGRTYDSVGHLHYTAYRYADGRLVPQADWYGPQPEALDYPRDAPSVLLAALTAVSLQLPAEAPRYFVSPQVGTQIYQQLTAQLPAGAIWSLAGQPAAGPPTAGTATSVALTATVPGLGGPFQWNAQVTFVRAGERFRIAALAMTPAVR